LNALRSEACRTLLLLISRQEWTSLSQETHIGDLLRARSLFTAIKWKRMRIDLVIRFVERLWTWAALGPPVL
jgi:hypothetical protein